MSQIEVEELFAFSDIGVGTPRAVGFAEDETVLVSTVVATEQKRVPRKHTKGSSIETLYRHRVTAWRDGAVWRSDPTEPIGDVHFVQRLGEDLLLVRAWCEQRRSGPVSNAHVVEWSGALVRSAVFGVGIVDVRAGRERVWCSYLDQGVLSQDTLGPGGEPMGCDGVRAFDRSGVALSLGGALAQQEVIDVYALNVCADDDLWIYAYTAFDLLHLRRGSLSVYRTGVRGARAVCIDGDRALLVGDYERGDRAVELSLYGRQAPRERALRLPWSPRDSRALRFRAHGATLYVWDEERVGRAKRW